MGRAEALLLRSKVYRSAEHFEEASQDCEEILKLTGAHLEEVQFLAVRELKVTLQIQANRSIGEGGIASAHRCLNRIIELWGENFTQCLHAYLDRGVLFAKQIPPDWNRAIADFSTVIENTEAADPIFLQAKVNRCECYRGLQHYPSALEDANSVIDQSTPPNQVWIAAMFARARIHVAEDRKVQARLDTEQILTHIDSESDWWGRVKQLLEATDD